MDPLQVLRVEELLGRNQTLASHKLLGVFVIAAPSRTEGEQFGRSRNEPGSRDAFVIISHGFVIHNRFVHSQFLRSVRTEKYWQRAGCLDCKNGKCYLRERLRPNSLETSMMNFPGGCPVIFLNSFEKWAW